MYFILSVLLLSISSNAFAHNDQTCPDSFRLSAVQGLDDPGRFALGEHYAYLLTDSGRELTTIDISDPDDISVVSTLDVKFLYHGIIVHENAAYLTAGWVGVQVVDLSTPDSPTLGEYFVPERDVYRPVIIGDYMYAGKKSVYQISDPLHPVPVGNMDLRNHIADEQHGLTYTTHIEYVDMSNPLNPVVQSGANDHGGSDYTQIDIDPETNLLYAYSTSRIGVYDISDPRNPTEILSERIYPDNHNYRSVRRGSLILTNGSNYQDESDIYVFDTNAGRGLVGPLLNLEVLPTALESAIFIQERDTVTYIATSHSFGAYEISTDPYVASVNTQGETTDIHLYNDLAITAIADYGVEIYDATDPTRLNRLSNFDSIESAFSIDTSRDTLYIAADRDDLVLVDISDPSNPVQISTIETGRRARDVRAIGNTLFVIDRIDGLWIFDINDPTNPLLRSNLDLPGWNDQISFNDDMTLACIASANFGAFIVDISDLDAPVHLSTIEPLLVGDSGNGIMTSTFVGNTLYTPEFTEGFRIWDISNPANPIETNHIYFTYPDEDDELQPIAYQLTLHKDKLIIANGNNGLAVFNNTDPTAPVFERFFKGESTRRVELNADLAYAASTNGGLKVFNLGDCSPCVADFNIDGELNFFDVSDFLIAYLDEDPRADLNSDSLLNFYDVSFFLSSYSYGCP